MNGYANAIKLEQYYQQSPIHKYQNPQPHEYNQNSNYSQGSTQIPGPYGVAFEDNRKYNFEVKKKYREELDYLMSLKQKKKDEDHELKLQENQQYSQHFNSIRNVDSIIKNDKKRYYQDYMSENMNKAINKERNRSDDGYRPGQSFIDMQVYKHDQKEDQEKKKNQMKQLQDDEVHKFNNKKEIENLKSQELKKKSLEDIAFLNWQQDNRTAQYRNKINRMNDKIYNNAINYKKFVRDNTAEPFHVKNDYEFNKLKAENQRVKAYTPNAGEEHFHDRHPQRNPQLDMPEYKLSNQKNYKDQLDKQVDSNKNLKLLSKEDTSRSQVLLPSYYYPNLPVPLNKAAYDSIDTIKNHKLFTKDEETSRMVSRHGIDNDHTLLDSHKRNEYLGNTTLLHNPIINPIDDVNRNVYLDIHKYRHVHHNPNNILKSVGYNIIN